jgi:hypothetical protein
VINRDLAIVTKKTNNHPMLGWSFLVPIFVAGTSLLLFQNCSSSSNSSTKQNQGVQVTCYPNDQCMHFSVNTIGIDDCFSSYNKVKINTYPSVNGSALTAVSWNSCLAKTNEEACCPEGLVTASFRNTQDGRTLSVSFTNGPSQFIDYSNKATNQ